MWLQLRPKYLEKLFVLFLYALLALMGFVVVGANHDDVWNFITRSRKQGAGKALDLLSGGEVCGGLFAYTLAILIVFIRRMVVQPVGQPRHNDDR